MRSAAQRFVSSLLVVAAASCGDDPPAATGGRPATFGDTCMLGGLDACQDPFVCLELPDFSMQGMPKTICTVACQQAEDCPAWEGSSEACKSQCVRQICHDACE